jgi:hypothetical protein
MSASMAKDADQPLPPSYDVDTQSMMNLSLLDPPRWGWTALGGICDLLPPHEVSTILVNRNTGVCCLQGLTFCLLFSESPSKEYSHCLSKAATTKECENGQRWTKRFLGIPGGGTSKLHDSDGSCGSYATECGDAAVE